jgi:hypothetical protein
MTIPNLIHPVPIKIEQLDTGATYYDEDAREPIQFAARKTLKTVEGQVKWGAQKDDSDSKMGSILGARGYVLFRRIDLAAQSIELADGDRFTEIGGISTDVYISRLEWTGHYPDEAGPTMVKAYFEDRAPAKQGA